jgi:hypothetical protein
MSIRDNIYRRKLSLRIEKHLIDERRFDKFLLFKNRMFAVYMYWFFEEDESFSLITVVLSNGVGLILLCNFTDFLFIANF